MASKIVWAAFDDGWLGILPCGLTIAIHRISVGQTAGMFRVRFGTAELETLFPDPNDAKLAGIVLARRVLTECLVFIEEV